MSFRRLAPLLGVLVTAPAFAPALAQSSRVEGSAGSPASSGAAAAPSSLQAIRRDGSITLDGKLDEAAWAKAPAWSAFTQSYPKPGTAPVDSTSVRVLWDDAAVYVGVRLYDAHPDSIAAQLARRDAGGIYSDWVHVIIDSYHDRRTAFRFTVNPKGVQKDVYTSNDGNEDVNWDAVWQAATHVDSLGWVAEYRIPLSQLRYGTTSADSVGRVWGFQVMRDVARRNERDSFSPWTPQAGGFVSLFGTLTGLGDLPSPRRLELLPYLSSKATRAPGSSANPFYHATDVAPSIGGDVRYGLPGGFTLTATINPDFGQVEVDPAVVNLTAFETFFPEKRPFFLEGSDVFSFGNLRSQNRYAGATFLYSRRIGRPPTRPGNGADVVFAHAPEQTRILGAAKISGKRGPWTVGFLNALTSREMADISTSTGALGTTPVEPRADYFAGRVRRDFRRGQTVVGAMVTGVARDLQDDVFAPLLATKAGFGGVDFEHSWQRRKYYLSGYYAQSLVEGSTNVITALQRNSIHYYQRPDAAGYLGVDPKATSLGGHVSALAFQKTGEWFGSFTVQDGSPGFDINDVGFHSRVDYRAISSLFGYQTNRGTKHLRNRSIYVFQNSTWNWGGASIFQGLNANTNVTFTNFWGVSAGAGVQPNRFNDKLLRGGPLALTPSGWTGNVYFNTDTRKPIWFNPGANFSRDASGANNVSWNFYADARPTTTLHLTIGPSLGRTYSTSQYVRAVADPLAASTYGTRYVFADLHQSTLSIDTRVEWTLTRALSLQTYVQPFVSAGRYDRFKEFETPRKYDFAVYGVDRGTVTQNPGTITIDPDGPNAAGKSFVLGDPNFNVRSLRGNAVVRWEYRPGSAIFFVWQQQRSGSDAFGDFDAGRDFGAIFRTRPTNVFLVKATYWFSA